MVISLSNSIQKNYKLSQTELKIRIRQQFTSTSSTILQTPYKHLLICMVPQSKDPNHTHVVSDVTPGNVYWIVLYRIRVYGMVHYSHTRTHIPRFAKHRSPEMACHNFRSNRLFIAFRFRVNSRFLPGPGTRYFLHHPVMTTG